jgi:hypothetical protein
MAENKIDNNIDGLPSTETIKVNPNIPKDRYIAEDGDTAHNYEFQQTDVNPVTLDNELTFIEKQQIAVEQGRSMSRKGSFAVVGYQPDDSIVDDDKKRMRLAKGSANNSSTWLAVLIQRWFDRVVQVSS